MEGALKFARAATQRPRVFSLGGAFHGLSLGSLSLMGCESFTEGFGPLMQGFDGRIALDDLETLEGELAKKDVAAFVIEPVQGKGVNYPRGDFFIRAQELCRKIRHPPDLRRNPDRPRAHRQNVWLRALESRAGHHHSREDT